MPAMIMLVSRSPVLRAGIRNVFESTLAAQIIGEAGNGLEAVALAYSRRPDLAIVQDSLEGVSGVVAARAIHEASPATKVAVLTESCDERRIVSAILYGVDALVPADIDGNGLIEIVHALYGGERILERMVLTRPELAAHVFQEVRSIDQNIKSIRAHALTGREIAILDGVVRGLSNREIADGLYVVEQTIKNHVTSLLRKLRADDRTEAVVAAVRNRIVEIEEPVLLPPHLIAADLISAA
jgi:DNA-binding NarL/FixJ family response regulator